MINILLIGCLGRLGSEISSLVSETEGYQIIAGLDIKKDTSKKLEYKIYNGVDEIIDANVIADVVIDFSAPLALKSTLSYCSQTATALVLGTTDISDEDKQYLLDTSKLVPIFWSVNMSTGVNILASLCTLAVDLSKDNCEIDIIEKHHHNKLDAPSGTASLIASLIKLKSDALFGSEKKICSNKFNLNQARKKDEIRVHSIRSGSAVGKHEIIFNIGDETLSLSHTASSKRVFARGAINAADFIIKQKPGIYGALNEFNIR